MKKTDIEKLKGLKLTNNLKREGQRAGKPAQPGGGKPVHKNKLLTALLGKPAPEQDKS